MPNLKLHSFCLIVCFLVITHTNAQVSKNILSLLNQNNCKIALQINQYDHSRYNLLVNHTQSDLDQTKQNISFLKSVWNVETAAELDKKESNVINFTVKLKCLEGKLDQSSVSVLLNFSNWSDKNYVLFPSAAYNGNRYAWRKLRYSPKLYEVQDIGADKPIILTDVPKLNEQDGVSRIQERVGSLATPCVGFHSPEGKKGMFLNFNQYNELGDYGIGIEESRDRAMATISLTSPLVRELYTYRSNDAHAPSTDVPHNFKAGEVVTFKFQLYVFNSADIPALFTKYAEIRKSTRANDTLKNTLPFSACFSTLEEKFNTKNFVPEHGYYSVGMRENFLQDWQIGWTGGMISTYPLLVSGSSTTRNNVLRNFDWLFPKGISPSGFYWDAGKGGTEWYGGDIRKPHTGNWHLIRKSGDAVFYIIKQFMYMKQAGMAVKPGWEQGNRTVCDALVTLWNKNHQLGQFVDSQTGEIRVGGSASGAIVPAALVLAAKYYNQETYLKAAVESGKYFNENFTLKGITCGGPGDALQNFDSESAYALIESYAALFEATGDKYWLIAADQAVKQFSTWVVSYKFKFPEESLFNKLGINTIGAVYANTQNKHASPAICTYSGLALLNLYRYTGNNLYLDLLKDIAHHMPQYMPHPLKPIGNAQYGFISERVNLTDWEGVKNIGSLFALSTWAETSLMLTTVEIPGIYVQPDKDLIAAFDNIKTEILKSDKGQLVVKLTNTTPINARVSVLEDRMFKNTRKPVCATDKANMNLIEIKPYQSKTITFKKKMH